MDLSWLEDWLQPPDSGGAEADLNELLATGGGLEDDFETPPEEPAEEIPTADESEAELLGQIRSLYNTPAISRPAAYRPATPSVGEAYHAPTRTSSPSAGKGSDAARAAHHYLQDRHGLSAEAAAGIVGNLMQESGINTHAVGDGGKARGLAQWHPDRWAGVVNAARKAGADPYDTNFQLDYILSEPGESARMLKRVQGAKTAREAAYAFAQSYERPARIEDIRLQNAESLLRQQGGSAIRSYIQNEDSGLMDVLELLDPTGITSWDDVYRSAVDPNQSKLDTGLEVLGALPLLGKVGRGIKVAKGMNTVENAHKLLQPLIQAGNYLDEVIPLAKEVERLTTPAVKFKPGNAPAYYNAAADGLNLFNTGTAGAGALSHLRTHQQGGSLITVE